MNKKTDNELPHSPKNEEKSINFRLNLIKNEIKSSNNQSPLKKISFSPDLFANKIDSPSKSPETLKKIEKSSSFSINPGVSIVGRRRIDKNWLNNIEDYDILLKNALFLSFIQLKGNESEKFQSEIKKIIREPYNFDQNQEFLIETKWQPKNAIKPLDNNIDIFPKEILIQKKGKRVSMNVFRNAVISFENNEISFCQKSKKKNLTKEFPLPTEVILQKKPEKNNFVQYFSWNNSKNQLFPYRSIVFFKKRDPIALYSLDSKHKELYNIMMYKKILENKLNIKKIMNIFGVNYYSKVAIHVFSCIENYLSLLKENLLEKSLEKDNNLNENNNFNIDINPISPKIEIDWGEPIEPEDLEIFKKDKFKDNSQIFKGNETIIRLCRRNIESFIIKWLEIAKNYEKKCEKIEKNNVFEIFSIEIPAKLCVFKPFLRVLNFGKSEDFELKPYSRIYNDFQDYKKDFFFEEIIDKSSYLCLKPKEPIKINSKGSDFKIFIIDETSFIFLKSSNKILANSINDNIIYISKENSFKTPKNWLILQPNEILTENSEIFKNNDIALIKLNLGKIDLNKKFYDSYFGLEIKKPFFNENNIWKLNFFVDLFEFDNNYIEIEEKYYNYIDDLICRNALLEKSSILGQNKLNIWLNLIKKNIFFSFKDYLSNKNNNYDELYNYFENQIKSIGNKIEINELIYRKIQKMNISIELTAFLHYFHLIKIALSILDIQFDWDTIHIDILSKFIQLISPDKNIIFIIIFIYKQFLSKFYKKKNENQRFLNSLSGDILVFRAYLKENQLNNIEKSYNNDLKQSNITNTNILKQSKDNINEKNLEKLLKISGNLTLLTEIFGNFLIGFGCKEDYSLRPDFLITIWDYLIKISVEKEELDDIYRELMMSCIIILTKKSWNLLDKKQKINDFWEIFQFSSLLIENNMNFIEEIEEEIPLIMNFTAKKWHIWLDLEPEILKSTENSFKTMETITLFMEQNPLLNEKSTLLTILNEKESDSPLFLQKKINKNSYLHAYIYSLELISQFSELLIEFIYEKTIYKLITGINNRITKIDIYEKLQFNESIKEFKINIYEIKDKTISFSDKKSRKLLFFTSVNLEICEENLVVKGIFLLNSIDYNLICIPQIQLSFLKEIPLENKMFESRKDKKKNNFLEKIYCFSEEFPLKKIEFDNIIKIQRKIYENKGFPIYSLGLNQEIDDQNTINLKDFSNKLSIFISKNAEITEKQLFSLLKSINNGVFNDLDFYICIIINLKITFPEKISLFFQLFSNKNNINYYKTRNFLKKIYNFLDFYFNDSELDLFLQRNLYGKIPIVKSQLKIGEKIINITEIMYEYMSFLKDQNFLNLLSFDFSFLNYYFPNEKQEKTIIIQIDNYKNYTFNLDSNWKNKEKTVFKDEIPNFLSSQYLILDIINQNWVINEIIFMEMIKKMPFLEYLLMKNNENLNNLQSKNRDFVKTVEFSLQLDLNTLMNLTCEIDYSINPLFFSPEFKDRVYWRSLCEDYVEKPRQSTSSIRRFFEKNLKLSSFSAFMSLKTAIFQIIHKLIIFYQENDDPEDPNMYFLRFWKNFPLIFYQQDHSEINSEFCNFFSLNSSGKNPRFLIIRYKSNDFPFDLLIKNNFLNEKLSIFYENRVNNSFYSLIRLKTAILKEIWIQGKIIGLLGKNDVLIEISEFKEQRIIVKIDDILNYKEISIEKMFIVKNNSHISEKKKKKIEKNDVEIKNKYFLNDISPIPDIKPKENFENFYDNDEKSLFETNFLDNNGKNIENNEKNEKIAKLLIVEPVKLIEKTNNYTEILPTHTEEDENLSLNEKENYFNPNATENKEKNTINENFETNLIKLRKIEQSSPSSNEKNEKKQLKNSKNSENSEEDSFLDF